MSDLVHGGAGAGPNAAALYLARLAPSGRVSMHNCLDRAARLLSGRVDVAAHMFPWHGLQPGHATALRHRLVADGYSPATVNLHLAALRGVMKQCWLGGAVTRDVYERFCASAERVSGSRELSGRMLSDAEVRQVLTACDASPVGQRDAVIFVLGLCAGFRRVEIARVDLAGLGQGGVTVIGKGDKARRVALPTVAQEVIAAWVARRGMWPGPLVTRFDAGGKLTTTRLTPGGVSRVFAALAERSRVDFTPHDLRRTYISNMLAKTDVVTVARQVGHADPRTTMQYDRRNEDAARAAVEAVVSDVFDDDGDDDDVDGA